MKRGFDAFAPKARARAPIAFDFVLERLEGLDVHTRAMFGSTAIYIGEQVVFILRQKGDSDDGIWVAFEPSREVDVLALLPSLVPIGRIPNARGWRKLAADSVSFEDAALRACQSLRSGQSPLGKVPVRRAAKTKTPGAKLERPRRALSQKRTAKAKLEEPRAKTVASERKQRKR